MLTVLQPWQVKIIHNWLVTPRWYIVKHKCSMYFTVEDAHSVFTHSREHWKCT